MEDITITWYGPYKLSNILNHEVFNNCGVYSIYRKYGNSYKLIYIGQTIRPFYSRLKEHEFDWLWALKGLISIRVGIISFSNNKKFSKKKLDDIENLLIMWHNPENNARSNKLYYGKHNININNIGRRGLIEKRISTESLDSQII